MFKEVKNQDLSIVFPKNLVEALISSDVSGDSLTILPGNLALRLIGILFRHGDILRRTSGMMFVEKLELEDDQYKLILTDHEKYICFLKLLSTHYDNQKNNSENIVISHNELNILGNQNFMQNHQEDVSKKIMPADAEMFNELGLNANLVIDFILKNESDFQLSNLRNFFKNKKNIELEIIKYNIKELLSLGFIDTELACLLIHSSHFMNLQIMLDNIELFKILNFTASESTNLLTEISSMVVNKFSNTLIDVMTYINSLKEQEKEKILQNLTELKSFGFKPEQIIRLLSFHEEFFNLDTVIIDIEKLQKLDFTAERIIRVILHHKDVLILEEIQNHFDLFNQLQITAEHLISLIAKKINLIEFLITISKQAEKIQGIGLTATQLIDLWEQIDTFQIPDNLRHHFNALKYSKYEFTAEQVVALFTYLIATLSERGITPEHITTLISQDNGYQLLESLNRDFDLYIDFGFSIKKMLELLSYGVNACNRMKNHAAIFKALGFTAEKIITIIKKIDINNNEIIFEKKEAEFFVEKDNNIDNIVVPPVNHSNNHDLLANTINFINQTIIQPLHLESLEVEAFNGMSLRELNVWVNEVILKPHDCEGVDLEAIYRQMQLEMDEIHGHHQNALFEQNAANAIPIMETLNNQKLDAIDYDDNLLPREILCSLIEQPMDDPVIDGKNGGCLIHFFPYFLEDEVSKKLLTNSYILTQQKLYYMNSFGDIELVKIDDFHLFSEKLLHYLDPFGETNIITIKNSEYSQDNKINSIQNKTAFLLKKQIIDLITSNGGHICYHQVMERAIIEEHLAQKKNNPFSSLPLEKEDLQPVTLLKAQIDEFVANAENEIEKNITEVFEKINFTPLERTSLMKERSMLAKKKLIGLLKKVRANIQELNEQELANIQLNLTELRELGFEPEQIIDLLSHHENFITLRIIKINAKQFQTLDLEAEKIIQIISHHQNTLILQSIQDHVLFLNELQITAKHLCLLISKNGDLTAFLTTIRHKIDKIKKLDLTADQIINLWERIDELPVFNNLQCHLEALSLCGFEFPLDQMIALLHLIYELDKFGATSEHISSLLLQDAGYQLLETIKNDFYLFTQFEFSIDDMVELISYGLNVWNKAKAHIVIFRSLGVKHQEIIKLFSQADSYNSTINQVLIENPNLMSSMNPNKINNNSFEQLSIAKKIKELKKKLRDKLMSHEKLKGEVYLVNQLMNHLIKQLRDLLVNQPQLEFSAVSQAMIYLTQRILCQLNIDNSFITTLENQPVEMNKLVVYFMMQVLKHSDNMKFFQGEILLDENQQNTISVDTLNSTKLSVIDYDEERVPEKFLCALTGLIMTDPVVDERNNIGCTLYFLPDFQEQKICSSSLMNSYVLAKNKLYYVDQYDNIELVKLDDIELFRETLLYYLNPFGTLTLASIEDFEYVEDNGNINSNKKIFLSKQQIAKLITLNGGHTYYYNAMERAVVESMLDTAIAARHPLLTPLLKQEDLQPVPLLKEQINHFVKEAENEAVKNVEKNIVMRFPSN